MKKKKSTSADIPEKDQEKAPVKRKKTAAEKDFPGYPHYQPEDDIMNPANGMEPADVDVNDLSRFPNSKKTNNKGKENTLKYSGEQPLPPEAEDEESENNPGSEADVSKEDLELLGSDELNADLGEDDDLKKRVYPVDMSAEDLDFPGEELDDEDDVADDDEENNPFSIGGDRHEDLEEEGDPGR